MELELGYTSLDLAVLALVCRISMDLELDEAVTHAYIRSVALHVP